MGNTLQKVVYPGPYPETGGTPTFESHYGFPTERKKRVMQVSEDVLIAAQVPKELRDYCAHLYIDFMQCYRKKFPFPQVCRDEIHNYQLCEYEDQVLRMKEYERERRLLLREQRKKKAMDQEVA